MKIYRFLPDEKVEGGLAVETTQSGSHHRREGRLTDSDVMEAQTGNKVQKMWKILLNQKIMHTSFTYKLI